MRNQALLLTPVVIMALLTGPATGEETKVPVTFTGGHEYAKTDFGRPVVLIAAALGVAPDVFREAFSGVTPAKGGKPSDEEAKRNKAALMKVLKPHGVTNERLNEVSNFYRFQPQKGDLWKHAPAQAHALVENGKIKQIVVSDPGYGYSSPPRAVVQGLEQVPLRVQLHFDKELTKNGGIKSIEILP
jgi:hypothetical protein